MGVQAAMIAKISSLFGMNIMEGNLKSILSVVLGPLLAKFLGKTVIAGFLKMVPGVGSVAGGLIDAGVASTVTKLVGNLYIEVIMGFAEKNKNSHQMTFLESLEKDYVCFPKNKSSSPFPPVNVLSFIYSAGSILRRFCSLTEYPAGRGLRLGQVSALAGL